MKEDHSGYSFGNSLRLWIRICVHIVFWQLLLVWGVQPRSPSRFFRTALFVSAGLVLFIMLWPRIRRPVLGFIHRRIRIFDILTVNLLILIVLAEASVWVLGTVYDMPILSPTDASAAIRIRHHRGRPHGMHNGQRLNALGFFDTEFELPRKPDVKRIVALADSFGAGVVPYEQNFLTLLDEALDHPVPTEVLNFGIPGAGPPEYLHLYRTEARGYEPDQVLLCFFIGNDFITSKSRSILHADRLRSLAVVKRLLAQQGIAADITKPKSDEPTFTEESFVYIEQKRLEICRVFPSHRIRRSFEDTFKYLESLHEEAGSRLKVAIIPDEFQVSDSLFQSLVKERAAEFDRNLPNRKLKAFLDARGIPYLDLLGTLREAEENNPTYKSRDTHWNQCGNSVAADAIARWLQGEA